MLILQNVAGTHKQYSLQAFMDESRAGRIWLGYVPKAKGGLYPCRGANNEKKIAIGSFKKLHTSVDQK